MHLSFAPSLNQATTLQLPVTTVDHDLKFKATFDSRWAYEQAKRDGVRVEMWTDLPVSGVVGDDAGWRALVFQFPDELVKKGESSSQLFSLVSSPLGEQDDTETSVYLQIKLPSSAIPLSQEVRYSFTYRLVHSNGGIEWLGAYGQNGVVVIQRGDVRLNLTSGFTVSGERLEVVIAQDSGVEDREVGQLNVSLDWENWAVGKQGYPGAPCAPTFSASHTAERSTTLVLIPSADEHLVSLHPLVFSASRGATVSISQSGGLILHPASNGDSRVTVTTGQIFADPSFSVDSQQVVHYDGSSGFAVLATALEEHLLPVTVSVIPLTARARNAGYFDINVPLKDLTSVCKGSTGDLVFYSPRLSKISSAHTNSDDHIAIRVSPSGDQFLVAPLHTISAAQSDIEVANKDSQWNAAILNLHTSAELVIPRNVTEGLPTPPPSPPVRTAFLTNDSIDSVVNTMIEANETHPEPEAETRAEEPEFEVASPLVSEVSEPTVIPSSSTSSTLDLPGLYASTPGTPAITSQQQPSTVNHRSLVLRSSNTPFRIRTLVKVAIEFFVRVILGKLFGIVGILLALIGWQKCNEETGPQKVEPDDEEIEDVASEEKQPEKSEKHEETEPVVPPSETAEESIVQFDDSRSDTTAVAEDAETSVTGALMEKDTPLEPSEEKAQEEATNISPMPQRSPYFSYRGVRGPHVQLIIGIADKVISPSNLSVSFNGKPITAISYRLLSNGNKYGTHFHLVEFGEVDATDGDLQLTMN